MVGANDRVRMAIIGSGGRGNQVLTSFAQAPNNVFVAACDVFKERLDSTVQRLGTDGNKVDGYEDYRRILDRKDIDAVLIATPDHWHPQITIDACDAGKDVYMEKPACNAATIEAAAKIRRGAQDQPHRAGGHPAAQLAALRRGPRTAAAARWRHARHPAVRRRQQSRHRTGHSGPARAELGTVPGTSAAQALQDGSPAGWRYYWDYGGGLVTDWGVHLADTALWFMDAQLEAPKLTTGVGQFVNVQTPDIERPFNAFTASWQYDTFVMTFSNAVIGNPDFPFHGTVFIGPRGSLVVNRTGYMLRPPERGLGGGRGRGAGPGAAAAAPAPAPPPTGRGQDGRRRTELEMVATATTLHVKNFLDCVKSRQQPVSEPEVGFYATLPCVLAIRAMREGRAIGWDTATMKAKAL